MFILHTSFHIPRFKGQLVIAVKIKGKGIFHMVVMLLVYILQKIILTGIAWFSVICYHTHFRGPIYAPCSYHLWETENEVGMVLSGVV
jgi:hypothetical protein